MTTKAALVRLQMALDPATDEQWDALARQARMPKVELFRRLVRRLSDDPEILRELIREEG